MENRRRVVEEAVVHTDGAARGNPGPAGIGYLIYDAEGNVLAQEAAYLGETTNNVAEYTALLRALERASALGCGQVRVYSDSELLVRQLNGQYRVRQPHLVPLHAEARQLLARFARASVSHVPRERNKEADRLSNEGIDRHLAAPAGPGDHLPGAQAVVESDRSRLATRSDGRAGSAREESPSSTGQGAG